MASRIALALVAALGVAGMSAPGARAADITRGGQAFALHCATCHGPAGQGIFPGSPRFNRGDRMMQSDLALLNSIKWGRNAMPAFNGVLRDREILDVIAYLRTLRR